MCMCMIMGVPGSMVGLVPPIVLFDCMVAVDMPGRKERLIEWVRWGDDRALKGVMIAWLLSTCLRE